MKVTSSRLMKNSPSDQALISSTAEATQATPAESPSMLSSRLKAFVIPTSQRSVTTRFIHSKGRNEVATPEIISTAAAAVWPAALAQTGKSRPRTSSARPTTKTSAPPANRASSFCSTRCASVSGSSAGPKAAWIHSVGAITGSRK
jgi:hypothetical protein